MCKKQNGPTSANSAEYTDKWADRESMIAQLGVLQTLSISHSSKMSLMIITDMVPG